MPDYDPKKPWPEDPYQIATQENLRFSDFESERYAHLVGERFRHATGSIYEIVGIAALFKDSIPMIIYRQVDGPIVMVRPASEFVGGDAFYTPLRPA